MRGEYIRDSRWVLMEMFSSQLTEYKVVFLVQSYNFDKQECNFAE